MYNSNSNSISNDSNPRRRAACKYLRRRCSQDCTLSPYFPASNPHRFACVHRIFSASSVTRMLQDPVNGSVGIITRLQDEIYMNQCELALTQAQVAMYTAQQQQVQPNDPLESQFQTQQLEPFMTSLISQISFKVFHNFSLSRKNE